jgi:hypothetical protein
MNHEAAVPLIGELLHGRLSSNIKSEVLAHVTSCDDCRSLSETHAVISEAWHDDTLEHPPSELIVAYALGEEVLEERVRDRIATHVLACELCAGEIEVTSQAEAELTGDSRPSRERPQETLDRRWLIAPAIAAAVVLTVLAYPAYLGLFEVPRINNRLAVLEAERTHRAAPAWSGGAVEMAVLQSPVRGAGDEIQSIELAANQPYVPLAVVPGTLDEYTGTETVYFDIRDSDGGLTWSWKLGESELRQRVQRRGVVALFVPSEQLPSGQWTLSVSRGSNRAELVFEAPFSVTRFE